MTENGIAILAVKIYNNNKKTGCTSRSLFFAIIGIVGSEQHIISIGNHLSRVLLFI